MGQIVSALISSGRHILNRVCPDPAAELPRMETRRRVWLRGNPEPPDGIVTVSSLFHEPARRLSQHNGRLLGGGRSDRPLSPRAVIDSRLTANASSPRMAEEPSIRLDVLRRDLGEPPRSPVDCEAQSTHDGFWSADCCPRCTPVPEKIRRRKFVIPLALTLLTITGVAGSSPIQFCFFFFYIGVVFALVEA